MTPGFGRRLAHARRAAGLSQETLAAQLGVTRAALRWLEHRETGAVDETMVSHLATRCGVSVAYLEGREASTPCTAAADLGTRIAYARAHAGLSQEALAARLGVERHTIARLERGATANPGVRWIVKIVEATGADLYWLLGRTPPKQGEDDAPEAQ